MRRSWFLAASVALAATLFPMQILAAEQDNPTIEVRLYNYGSLPRGHLVSAMRTSQYVLGKAGLKMEWVECPIRAEDRNAYPRCRRPRHQAALVLKIVPDNVDRRSRLPKNAFGLALVPEDGSQGTNAYIFSRRVERLAAANPEISVAVVLGCVAAHEIGHLLLGSNAHHRSGIMTAGWYAADLRRAATGDLLFTKEQGAQLQKEARRRAVPEYATSEEYDRGAEGTQILSPLPSLYQEQYWPGRLRPSTENQSSPAPAPLCRSSVPFRYTVRTGNGISIPSCW